jgi:antitoxin HicB
MRTYSILVEPEETGGFSVIVPTLPGSFTRGDTLEDCRERAVEAIAVHIAGVERDGQPVPRSVSTRSSSPSPSLGNPVAILPRDGGAPPEWTSTHAYALSGASTGSAAGASAGTAGRWGATGATRR